MTRRLLGLLIVLAVLIVIGGVYVYVAAGSPKSFTQALQSIPAVFNLPARETDPDGVPRSTSSTDFRSHAFDWPQWQGPDRTAVSKEPGLLQDWPKGGPRLVWQADYAGVGFSTPTVAGGRVFLMGNRGATEYVLALSEEDGGELWANEIGPVRATGGGFPGPRCSPTVDGNRVYALGLGGDLVCLDAETGQEKWHKELTKFGGTIGAWGYCESPLVDGDKVVCTPGGQQATLLALGKETGEPVWKGPVPGGDAAHYASMIAIKVSGKREYVQFLRGGVVGLSDDGKFLWRYARPANGTANCSTPLFHDGCVFAASGYGTGGGLAKLDPETGANPKEVYFTGHMKNHHGGMVWLDGYLYGSDEGLLTCLDWKTGAVKWAERQAGKGSIAAADGRLYFRNEGGPMILIEANPSKYIEHGRFEPPQKSKQSAWPHPVIANGKLYLRDQQFLFCFDLKKP
jgi:outer membrane protein assembly factor BamB